MDPAIRVVDHLHRTLKFAAQYFAEQEPVSSEDIFIRSGVTQDIAATLADATAEAATLHQRAHGAHDNTTFDVEDFRRKHDKNVQAIVDDLLTVQTRGKEDDLARQTELVTTTAQFALVLVESTSQLIDHNMAKLEHQVPPSPLGGLRMSSPEFPKRLVTHVRQTLKAYVARDELYKEASAQAKELRAQITDLDDAFSTKVEKLQQELAKIQDDNIQLRGERDQLRVDSDLLRAEQEKLRRAIDLLASDKTSMEADHAGKMATAQAAIEKLTADISNQRAAHITLSSEMEQMKATIIVTADWSRMKAESEEKERERLLSSNQSLERQIQELKRKIQEQSAAISRKQQDTEVQTPLVLRLPAVRGSIEEPATPTSKRSHSRMEGGGGPTATQRTIRESRASFGTATPPEHLIAKLAGLPVVSADVPSSGSGVGVSTFTRSLLRSALGGNPAQLVVRVGKTSTPLASQYNIQLYLCATRSRHAWLPLAPGRHGFLPFELDPLADRTSESADPATPGGSRGMGMTCHLFIGNGDEPEALEYEYYGLYRLTNQELLTADDWALLPGYAQTPCIDRKIRQSRLKEGKAAPGRDAIRQMYSSGEYRLPCARLECVAFDVAFYKKLVEAGAEHREPPRPDGSIPDQQLSGLSPASKRRRMAGVAGGRAPSPQQDPEHNIDDISG
ncbi:hypothetical protein OH76DRAFT_1469169 [Lentinus brumalis]|uniref:DUF6697 domain-containing protein n=1 Tax=Lentinus brumalis TaxID=2498619 RepID=A0A371DPG9_9APHY|nr:hypothetical protein OH76DRAFT_1469169 [Polyporus brumalis]